MEYASITVEDLAKAIKNTANWKTPGIDNLQNFWYKKFTSLHKQIAAQFTYIVRNPEQTPSFMTVGKTFMKPKTNDTTNPATYRPITCLPTLYKLLTSCITSKIYEHLETQNIITEYQKGARKHSQGCKEQLIIDTVVMKQATKNNRNIHTAYIDYKKAFDNVPHAWLLKSLEIYKIHPQLISFLSNIIKTWKTTLHVKINNQTINTQQIEIKRGIFQGDSLSPIWFCLAMNPLSKMLEEMKGFKIRAAKRDIFSITHLMYMDDIKIYASNKTDLDHLLQTIHQFNTDIRMELGPDKCRILKIEKGEVVETEGSALDKDITIEAMKGDELYKYLGYQQSKQIASKQVKATLTKNFQQRLHVILKTQLSGKNKSKAINTYAIPLLTYSFGVINWTQTDIDNIERKVRTTLTKYRYHHPKSAIERVTLPREKGGRGIIDINNLMWKQIDELRHWFHIKQQESDLHRAIVQADKDLTPLSVNKSELDIKTKLKTDEHKMQAWTRKEMHGRHRHDINDKSVDTEASNDWLKYGNLMGETEGFVTSIQDQVIKTRNYQKYILKDSSIKNDK